MSIDYKFQLNGNDGEQNNEPELDSEAIKQRYLGHKVNNMYIY